MLIASVVDNLDAEEYSMLQGPGWSLYQNITDYTVFLCALYVTLDICQGH